MSILQQDYYNVLAQIAGVEASVGRSAGEIRLVTVGKTFPTGDIREMYAAGQHGFGKNYIQEWYEKTEGLVDLLGIMWHIIGDAQSDKTKFVIERVHWVHIIGRLKTARRLSMQRPSEMPLLQVCVEVNIVGGTAKYGVTPDEAAALTYKMVELPNLRMCGLIYAAKADTDEAEPHEAFDRMRALLTELDAASAVAGVSSMDISGDMKITVACDVTHVCIGSAIFGRQDYSR